MFVYIIMIFGENLLTQNDYFGMSHILEEVITVKRSNVFTYEDRCKNVLHDVQRLYLN